MAVTYIWDNESGVVPGCGATTPVEVTFSNLVWDSFLAINGGVAFGATGFCLLFALTTPVVGDPNQFFRIQFQTSTGFWQNYLSSGATRSSAGIYGISTTHPDYRQTMLWRLNTSFDQVPGFCTNVSYTNLTLAWTDTCTGGSGVPDFRGSGYTSLSLLEWAAAVPPRLRRSRSYAQIVD